MGMLAENLIHGLFKKPASYEGLKLQGDRLVALIGDKTEYLDGVAQKLLFRQSAHRDVDAETHVRPLVDLVFANIARELGFDFAYGHRRSMDNLVNQGISQLEHDGLLPAAKGEAIKAVMAANKDMWPKDVLPLLIRHYRLDPPQRRLRFTEPEA